MGKDVVVGMEACVSHTVCKPALASHKDALLMKQDLSLARLGEQVPSFQVLFQRMFQNDEIMRRWVEQDKLVAVILDGDKEGKLCNCVSSVVCTLVLASGLPLRTHCW